MGGRGSKGRPSSQPQPAAPPRSVDDRIRRAYQELTARPGELVSLARLRDMLPDLSREELDATLLTMDRRRELQLDPDPNRRALTQRAKDAAIFLGGEDMHWLTIDTPPDTDAPEATP